MSRLRILIVDDDRDFAASLGRVFEVRGHEVSLAFGGEEAVEKSRRADFDVAFVDLRMPGKDGLEYLHEIRRLKPNTDVVMMTGYTCDPRLDQAVDGGALGTLCKPFDLNAALDMARKVSPGV